MPPSLSPSSSKQIPCPLCQSNSASFLLKGKDRLHGVKGEWLVYQCSECELAFLNPIPNEEEISGFYPTHYYAYQPPSLPEMPKNIIKRLDFKIRQTRKNAYGQTLGYPTKWEPSRLTKALVAIFPPSLDIPAYIANETLLDIGCGAGHYLLEMKEMGWKVQGLELNSHAVEAAQSAKLDVFCGSLESASFKDGQFAFIRMNDVLEHVPDPEKTLSEIYRILIPGGKLQITLPNLDSWTFSIFREHWFPLEVPRHLYFFTPNSLTKLATKCGFAVNNLRVWSHKEVDVIPSMQYLLSEHYPRLYGVINKAIIWKLIRKLFAIPKSIANQRAKGSQMTIWLEK